MQDEKLKECSITQQNIVINSETTSAMFAKNAQSYNAKRNNRKQNLKSNMTCMHCGGIGHTKDNCFFILGFPEWHKLHGVKPDPTKMPKNLKNKGSSQYQAHAVTTPLFAASSSDNNVVKDTTANTVTIPEEHYHQLIGMKHQSDLSTFSA